MSGHSRTARIDHPEWSGDKLLPPRIPESALYRPLVDSLTTQGFTCWNEVSFLGSWIDVFARHPDGRTVAIELKVVDWQRALQQASRLGNAANEVYVGLWAPYVHRCLTQEALARFETAGVGVLAINGQCVVKLPARERQPRYATHAILPSRPSRQPT